MQLSELTVKGYKSLKDTTVSGLSKVTALIGANNSGKSAILEALTYLSGRGGTAHFAQLLRGVNDKDWFRDVTTGHSENPIEVTVSLIFSDDEKSTLMKLVPKLAFGDTAFGDTLAATFLIGTGNPSSVLLQQVMWSFRSKDFLFVTPTNPNFATTPNLGEIVTSTAPLTTNQEGIVTGVRSFDFANAEPLPVSDDRPNYAPLIMIDQWLGRVGWLPPERSFATAAAINAPLGGNPADLPREYQHLYNNDRPTAEIVERMLGELVPGVRRLLAPINQENSTTSIRISSDDLDYALIHAGHGVSCMLKVILEVATAEQGSTLLIEEPETALHAGAQRAVADLFERMARERSLQLLLTTHSSIFARENENASTILISQTDHGTVARNISSDDFPYLKSELGARNSDLFMSNMVLFCEDTGALMFYPTVFSLLDLDLASSGIHIVALHGSSKERIKRLREYLKYLGESDVRRFIVLDDDDGAKAGTVELVNEGLLSEDSVKIWSKDESPSEFEDEFSYELLIKAANAIAEQAGSAPKLEAKELQERAQKTGGTMVSKALLHYYYDTYDYGLSKVELASSLSDLLLNDPTLVPESFAHLIDLVRTELQKNRPVPSEAAVS